MITFIIKLLYIAFTIYTIIYNITFYLSLLFAVAACVSRYAFQAIYTTLYMTPLMMDINLMIFADDNDRPTVQNVPYAYVIAWTRGKYTSSFQSVFFYSLSSLSLLLASFDKARMKTSKRTDGFFQNNNINIYRQIRYIWWNSIYIYIYIYSVCLSG